MICSLCEVIFSAVDLVSRMNRGREHLLGLSDSMMNIAYIVGPMLAGIISYIVGDYATFSVVGVGVAFLSFLLLFVMPRKLRLPQHEISSWSM